MERNYAYFFMKCHERQDQNSSHRVWDYIDFSSTRGLVSSFQLVFKTIQQLVNPANNKLNEHFETFIRAFLELILIKRLWS